VAPVLPAAAPSDGGKDAAKGKARFVLQIGSFLDRSEAETFAKAFAPESPAVAVSELPGKGTWYRVRVGEFKGHKDALDAKSAFEKRYNKIALVVGPL
jgi:cell division protein FtsN